MREAPHSSELDKEIYHTQKATTDDAIGIIDVQVETWLATYINEEYGITDEIIREWFGVGDDTLTQETLRLRKEKIASSPYGVFVAKQDDKIVGFSSPIYDTEENYQRIGELYILPEAQGKGLGRRLLDEALNALDCSSDIYVQVFSYNYPAITFYEQNGFTKTTKDPSENGIVFKNGTHLPAIEMVKPATFSTNNPLALEPEQELSG